MKRPLSFLAAAVLASAVLAGVARADGDPASDVLFGANVFYPYSPPVSSALQRTLDAETALAARRHFPIKVALIDSPFDLGVVPSLFDKPQQYADFLDIELSYQTKQRLLVVMPDGYGVQGLTAAATAAAAGLPGPVGRQSDDLARAAINAVRTLASAAGHPIGPLSAAAGGNAGNGPPPLALAIIALAALAAATVIIGLRVRTAHTRTTGAGTISRSRRTVDRVRGEHGPWRPLTLEELTARRTTWRRRRARRRLLWSGLVACVIAGAIAALAVPGSAPRRAGRPRLASTSPLTGARRAPGQRPGDADQPSGATAPGPIERVLAYTPYIAQGTTHERDVALSFDDGPGPYTSSILRVLRRSHAPATFFVIGEWARLYPQLVRAEARDGFEIGDHTETHPFMSLLPAAVQRAEIVQAAGAIARAGAPLPHLWRPPYGAFNAATLAILHKLRMLMVLWTVDTKDYTRPGVAQITYVAVSGARPGAIILMHDGGGDRAETVAALPRIIAALRRHGYRLVTLSQLLADDPPPHKQPMPVPLSGTG